MRLYLNEKNKKNTLYIIKYITSLIVNRDIYGRLFYKKKNGDVTICYL